MYVNCVSLVIVETATHYFMWPTGLCFSVSNGYRCYSCYVLSFLHVMHISRQICAMSTKKKVALAASVPLESVEGKINWDICCICQMPGGDLTCPANNPNVKSRNVGYITLSENIERLSGTNHVFPSGENQSISMMAEV